MRRLSSNRSSELTRIMLSRAVRMRSGERLKIRKRATSAIKTKGGFDKLVWPRCMRRIPISSTQRTEVLDHFIPNPEPYGRYMSKEMCKYHNLVSTLRGVFKDDNPYPFAVIKNLYPTCALPWSTSFPQNDSRKWYLRDLVYDFISSGIIQLTEKGVHRRKNEGDLPSREYATCSDVELNILNEGTDLQLRYRQATPDLRLEGEAEYLRAEDTAARVIVFVCVENAIADPIYLLPTSEIFRNMAEDDVSALEEPSFSFFDRLENNLTQRHTIPNQSIALSRGTPESSWLSFDLNRMDLQTSSIDEQRDALRRLIETIEQLDKGKESREGAENWAESRSIPITLRRGDALVIDNYRMLFRRREQNYQEFGRLLWGRPPIRWLRVFYGFPCMLS